MRQFRSAVFILLFVVSSAGIAHALSSGPSQGFAGDPPPGNTCHNCHNSFPLNSGDGQLDLSGITSYVPGETYTLSVHIEDPDQSRWGFQLTAKDNANNGFQGVFTITDVENTERNGGYVNHTTAGTYNGAGEGNWSFQWTAPSEDVGPITFYYCGNAANGNFNNQGDYIYRESLTVEANVLPYDFTVLPEDDFVPAEGGSIDYTITLTTSIPQSFPGVDYWSKVILPNGSEYGPILQVNNQTIPPNANVSATFTLDVPSFAPSGEYLHHSNLGYFPNDVAVATWNFSKSASANGTEGASVWSDRGGLFELTANENGASAAIDTYSLADVYPNPFNAMTSIRVSLPDAATLTVTVHNVLGQTVATLADGRYAPGLQTFTLDASNLSSGVYFVQAVVPGHLNQIQKVMLVR